MQTKNATITDMDSKGKGLILLADLSEVDHDGDGYEAGAFGWKQQWAPLLTAHNRVMVPFGKARVYEEGDKALAEVHLNLATQSGKEWHSALIFDLEIGNPVQEWSYGYDPLVFEKVMRGMKEGRVLSKIDVHEVSTVPRGAGKGTRTLDMKGLKAALKEGEFDGLIDNLGTMATMLKEDPSMLSATGRKQLTEIHAALGSALVDPREAEAKALEAIEREATRHLTRDARRNLADL